METVRTNLELPKDLHKELKLIALQQKMDVEEILIEGAKEEVAKYKAARAHVKEHFNKYRPVREQVREQVNKYRFVGVSSDREQVMAIIRDLHKKGLPYQEIADHLNARRMPTLSGRGQWHRSTVARLAK